CPLNFSVDICGPSVVCQGESFTLTSNVFPRPQGYPYTYSWTTPLGTVITTPNLTINGAALTASGWYTLTVSLPPNCTYTTQVYVIVRPRPIATISNAVTGTVDNYIHMRTCDIQLTATGGVYYNWTVTSPPILTNHSNQLTLPTTLTSPTLINFRVVAIDSFGCASQQVLHRVRTANPVVSRSINNTSTNPNIIRTLTMNQTTQFANATYTWSTNGWSAGPLTAALKQRTGTIAQLAGIYTLVINQNGCERTFQFELLNNATFTPIIEIGTNKIYINEEIEMLNSEDEFELKAFPNPVSDILTVSFKNPSMDDIGLTITDINGRILMDKNIGNEELTTLIDVSSFATGMYFVQCTRNSVVYPEKLKIIKK
ncbi:MAG: T9SS C-terminal target domain-containing protein, partial [Flavobacteriales bacterium]|nr:T9SS C-terminal target domain-containing protein [Flavobacteriales bacterium]